MAGRKSKSRLDELISKLDYTDWFTNALVVNYIRAFPARFDAAGNDERMRQLLTNELDVTLTVYALLVYYVYPKKATFRKSIEANSEFKANFGIVKGWLDANNGRMLTDEFVGKLNSEVEKMRG